MKTLMFDMDGPLTVSKCEIQPEISAALYRAQSRARLVLVSGAGLTQIHKQLGHAVGFFDEIFYNSGNHNSEEWDYLCDEIEEILHTLTTWDDEIAGPRIQWRKGCLNYAACGQNASFDLRNKYAEWDAKCSDRLRLASAIESVYPELRATIGGRVSIDVTFRGKGKEQVPVDEDTTFFCDSLGPHGGDELLARKVLENGGSVVYTRSPRTTLRLISGESFL